MFTGGELQRGELIKERNCLCKSGIRQAHDPKRPVISDRTTMQRVRSATNFRFPAETLNSYAFPSSEVVRKD